MASAALRTLLAQTRASLVAPVLARQLSGLPDKHVVLPADTNQVVGLAEYAKEFLEGKAAPSDAVLTRTNLFFTDAMLCGASALALRTNAPTVLREEAKMYPLSLESGGIPLLGDRTTTHPEKALAGRPLCG